MKIKIVTVELSDFQLGILASALIFTAIGMMIGFTLRGWK